MKKAIAIHAGPTALAHLRDHGLRARDVAIIPAAAGDPKGLIFQKLDQWLFGEWLDNLALISPSRAFRQTLSRGKLPDRKDFHYYGANNAFHTLNWRLTIGEGERLRDAFAAFVDRPDMDLVRPL